jgi:hypothetical protein
MKLATNPQNLILSANRTTVVSPQKRLGLASVVSFLPVLAALSFALISIFVCVLAAQEQNESRAYQDDMRNVQIDLQIARPTPSQEAVDIAMAAYGIYGGEHVNWPIFDASLFDRGLTSGGTLDARRNIFVGVPAFTSWGILGSTLGHEIEIHGNQSFVSILALDSMNRIQQSALALTFAAASTNRDPRQIEEGIFAGTRRAERTAYLYEISSAKRYGLLADEIASIRDVMEMYYSEKTKGKH